MTAEKLRPTASSRANALIFMLDALALGTLALTEEVQMGVMIAVVALALLRLVKPFKATPKGAAVAYGLLIAGAVIIALYTRSHPILAAASTAPFIHVFLWFTPALYEARGWRLSLGFVELILASSLTTSLFLPVSILIYGLLGSVGLSCHFLAKELESQSLNVPGRSSDASGFSLPERYISRMLGVSCLIFLIAAIIFPFLPRTQGHMNFGNDQKTIGYTEEVNISDWRPMTGSGQGGSALILYSDKELPPEFYIGKGLIRSRTLDLFDGERWRSAGSLPARNLIPTSVRNPDKSVTFDAIREPLGTNSLPVPYGSFQVSPVQEQGSEWQNVNLLTNGDWSLSNSAHTRSHYKIVMSELSDRGYRELVQNDTPTDRQLFVPERYQSGPFATLSKKIFEGLRTDKQKLSALMRFFDREKFQGSTSGPTSELSADLKKRFTPLEQFLFIERQGHCELFSTATALLLRSAHIPTRLVSGFRLTHSSIQGMLMITPSDAHAWVEYWNPDRGWIALDPTPRVSGPSSAMRHFKNAYALLDAYWSRYILTYGESSTLISWLKDWKDSFSVQKIRPFFETLQQFIETQKEVFAITLGGILALGFALFFILRTWFPAPFLARDRAGQGPWQLRNERARMEKMLKAGFKSARKSAHPEVSASYALWQSRYREIRFGKGGNVTAQTLKELRQLRETVAEKIRSGVTRDLHG
ncbi:MAG: transglutaminase domain-containing protein [Methylotenera sp.]|nr:transglutaminase domain-containing protein [Oligoflexia bacterium]